MAEYNLVESENSKVKLNSETVVSPLITLPQYARAFPWPSLSAMRAYVHRAEELGLSAAFFRVKRRVLVDPQAFLRLVRGMEKSQEGATKNRNIHESRASAVVARSNEMLPHKG